MAKTPGERVYNKIMAAAEKQQKPKAKKPKPAKVKPKTKASSVGRRSRRKGAQWELAVCKALGTWWNATFRRTPQSGGWHKGAADGKGKLLGDLVQMDGDPFPFCVECKATERWSLDTFLASTGKDSLTAYLRQAWGSANAEGKPAMLISKRNSCPPVIFIPLHMLPQAAPCTMFLQFDDSQGNPHPVAVLTLACMVSMPVDAWKQPAKKKKT